MEIGRLIEAGPEKVRIEIDVTYGADCAPGTLAREHKFWDATYDGGFPGKWSKWPPIGTAVQFEVGPDYAGHWCMWVGPIEGAP